MTYFNIHCINVFIVYKACSNKSKCFTFNISCHRSKLAKRSASWVEPDPENRVCSLLCFGWLSCNRDPLLLTVLMWRTSSCQISGG